MLSTQEIQSKIFIDSINIDIDKFIWDDVNRVLSVNIDNVYFNLSTIDNITIKCSSYSNINVGNNANIECANNNIVICKDNYDISCWNNNTIISDGSGILTTNNFCVMVRNEMQDTFITPKRTKIRVRKDYISYNEIKDNNPFNLSNDEMSFIKRTLSN